jgi:hypothetical protein
MTTTLSRISHSGSSAEQSASSCGHAALLRGAGAGAVRGLRTRRHGAFSAGRFTSGSDRGVGARAGRPRRRTAPTPSRRGRCQRASRPVELLSAATPPVGQVGDSTGSVTDAPVGATRSPTVPSLQPDLARRWRREPRHRGRRRCPARCGSSPPAARPWSSSCRHVASSASPTAPDSVGTGGLRRDVGRERTGRRLPAGCRVGQLAARRGGLGEQVGVHLVGRGRPARGRSLGSEAGSVLSGVEHPGSGLPS